MENINLTSVNSETRAVIKRQVISMLRKGKKHKDIAEALGISKYAVDRISSFYKREGAKVVNWVKNVSCHLNRKRKSNAF